ncbi:hypothetical protein PCC7424_1737 [Gloeothece citriformis PCC 7424]|uniref:eCIS core domain-containing protein n=1 Tax=Gloeothece citriformis (strain PCC 7424) TaxID=65393 RepID=B7KB62_GLOC7|nr:DUF4157 domain-containing protein [Gloeothece citriformis]ACK70172.1 hypothetical protein PCC7424_1737 [Gloeothece citriformis PCC 7424]
MVFERPQKRASQEPQGRFSSQVFQRQYFSDEEEKQIRNRPMPVGMFNYAATLPTAPYSEPIQEKADESVTQTVSPEAEAMKTENEAVIQEKSEKQPNLTGLPDELKAGVENLSGYSLDDVRVHYNSPKPAQLQALAYTQGREIHVAPGQEEHLPHEAWHVVQQMQGRVKPTMQMKGVQINDDEGFEREADIMGCNASKIPTEKKETNQSSDSLQFKPIIQRVKFANSNDSLARSRNIPVSELSPDQILSLDLAFQNQPIRMILDDDWPLENKGMVLFGNGVIQWCSINDQELEIIREKANNYLIKKANENPHTSKILSNYSLMHQRFNIKTIRKANRIAGLIRNKYDVNNNIVRSAVEALENYVVNLVDPHFQLINIVTGNGRNLIQSYNVLGLQFIKFLISALRNLGGIDINFIESQVDAWEGELQNKKFIKAIAHRGDGATFDKMGGLLPRATHNFIYPHENENSKQSTIKALQSWWQSNSYLSGIECDIHLTADDVPIVTHTNNLEALYEQEMGNKDFESYSSDIRKKSYNEINKQYNKRFMTLKDWLELIENYVEHKNAQSRQSLADRLRVEIEMKHSGILTDASDDEKWRSTEKIVSEFLKKSNVSHLMDISIFNNSNVPVLRHQKAKTKTTLSQITYAQGGRPEVALKEVRFGMHQKNIGSFINQGLLDGKIVTFAPGLDHPGTGVKQFPMVKGLTNQWSVTIEQSIQSERHHRLTDMLKKRISDFVEGTGPVAIHTLTDHGEAGAENIVNRGGLPVGTPTEFLDSKKLKDTIREIKAKHPELEGKEELIEKAIQQATENNNFQSIGKYLIDNVPKLL